MKDSSACDRWGDYGFLAMRQWQMIKVSSSFQKGHLELTSKPFCRAYLTGVLPIQYITGLSGFKAVTIVKVH